MLLLASADASDSSDATMMTVLLSLGLIAVVAVLATLPALLARRRRNPATSPLAAGSFLWAIASAGLGLFDLFARQQWSKENLILMQSGYYDPRTATPPSLHPLAWTFLAIAYLALLIIPSLILNRKSAGPLPRA